MKAKFYWVALLTSAAMIAQANAGGRYGGGGGGGSRAFAAPAAPSRSAAASSYRGGTRNFGVYRPMYSSQRFSVSPMSPARSVTHRMNASSRSRSINARRFTSRDISSVNRLGQPRTGASRITANAQRHGNNAAQIHRGNGLPRNWQNHVAARQSASRHRGWDRNRDHTWHGHHCRFINGSWVIFDLGFYPWWYDDYPGGYYGYDDSVYDDSVDYPGQPYYSQGAYGSSDQSADSTVAASQEQLARLGYYRGEVDGIVGPETQRAIARFQSSRGLRITGYLTTDTLAALGAGRTAAY